VFGFIIKEDPQRLCVIVPNSGSGEDIVQTLVKAIDKLNIDYATVFSLAPYISENIITIIGICLLIGAMAKSSQVGSVWALKILFFSQFFRTLIYAGTVSNALESVGSLFLNVNDPEKSQRQGINQQEIDKLTGSKGFNKQFLEWFIGFSEGDGCFLVTGGQSIFSIHLHLADLPLLYFIQNQLNMGNVFLSKNSASFVIKAKKDVHTLIAIFNGNIFLLKKQLQFEKWVINYNLKNKTNIEIKSNQFKPTLNDGWLAGFIDAEGSFFVSVCKNRIVQRFALGQKDAELEFSYLSKLIGGNLEKCKNCFSRVIVNYSNLGAIINYLSIHGLYSIKAKSLENWLEIYDYRKNKPASEKVDYKQLKQKASLINQLRKIPRN
jgi:hypothetical protein